MRLALFELRHRIHCMLIEESDHIREKARREIARYVRLGQETQISHDVIDFIESCLKSGDPDFHPPTVKYVYRGMSVSLDFLQTILSTNDVSNQGTQALHTQFTSKHSSGHSSWTSDGDVAATFRYDRKEFDIVLRAPTKGTNFGMFLNDPAGLLSSAEIADFGNFKHEQEVLALGPVMVDQINWHRKLNVKEQRMTNDEWQTLKQLKLKFDEIRDHDKLDNPYFKQDPKGPKALFWVITVIWRIALKHPAGSTADESIRQRINEIMTENGFTFEELERAGHDIIQDA